MTPSTMHALLRFRHLLVTALAVGTCLAPAHDVLAEGKPTRGSGIKPDVLYHNYCSVCHGDRGDGNSRAINSLNPPPRNFLQSASFGRDYVIKVIRDGKPNTAMVGWGSQLNDKEIEELADFVRNTFMGAALNPKIQLGKKVYDEHCVRCHGPAGEGQATKEMPVPPKSLASPQAREELYPARMIDAITNGKSGTYMISYRKTLKKQEIEAVVAYIDTILMVPASKISGTHAHGGRMADAQNGMAGGGDGKADMAQPMPNGLKGDYAKGRKFFLGNCADCHGAKGDGQGKRAYFINPRPVDFTSAKARSRLNRPAIYTFTTHGKLGTEMPAWGKVLSEQEIADVSEYVFKAYIEPGLASAKSKK
jgi:mono/diheme cytochrome c family protein